MNSVKKRLNKVFLDNKIFHINNNHSPCFNNNKGDNMTSRYNGPEDRAINLMAQPTSDNIRLGHNRVLSAEMKYYGKN